MERADARPSRRRATSARTSCASRRASPCTSTCGWSPSSRECWSPARSAPRQPAPACGAWTPSAHEVDGHFQELFAYADRAAHHREVGDDDADRGARARGRPVRPRAGAPGHGGACTAVPAGVPARLSRAVLRVRHAAGGRPRSTSTTSDRPPVGGALAPWPSTPSAQPEQHRREEELTWPSRSGRRRAPTPVRAVRTGRRRRTTLTTCPQCKAPRSRTSRARPAAPTRVVTTRRRAHRAPGLSR